MKFQTLHKTVVPCLPVKPIEPPDSHHLSCAIGWLELGSPGDALDDLDLIGAGVAEHPDVLEVRWQIYARMSNWELALKTAEKLRDRAPERASGWIHHAYSLRRAEGGGLDAAWSVLSRAWEKFPKEPIIPYNLSCYAAQMGQLDEAWEWLHKAMEAAGDVDRIKQMALNDPDLVALRDRLKSL